MCSSTVIFRPFSPHGQTTDRYLPFREPTVHARYASLNISLTIVSLVCGFLRFPRRKLATSMAEEKQRLRYTKGYGVKRERERGEGREDRGQKTLHHERGEARQFDIAYDRNT